MLVYGHAGDANLHVRIAEAAHIDSDRERREWINEISDWYLHRVIKMGGTVTGEHGDGVARTGYLRRQYGDQNMAAFAALKKIFDPDYIMNPSKILSSDKYQD